MIENNDKKRRLLNLLFVSIIGVMLLFSILTFYNIHKYLHSKKWSVHAYEVINVSNKLLVNILEAQALVRTYYITNDKSYLDNLYFELKEIFFQFSQLKNITIDNPSQQASLDKLEPYLQERKKNMLQLVDIKSKKLDMGARLVVRGQFLSEEIKQMLEAIQAEEYQLLKLRNVTADNSLRSTIYTILVGNIMSILVLFIIMRLHNKQLAKSITAEEKIRISKILLNGILNGSNDPIAALDKDYKLIAYNTAFEVEFKKLFLRQIHRGGRLFDFISNGINKNKLEQYWQKALQGENFSVIEKMGREDTEVNIYELDFSSILDNEDKLIGAAQVIRNIEKQVKARENLMQSKRKTESALVELQSRNAQIKAINELVGLLQLASNMEEVIRLIKRYLVRLLPETKGNLYVFNASRNYLQKNMAWNEPAYGEEIILPENCWGLKQGKTYHFISAENMIPCAHLKEEMPQLDYFCIPLLAQNDLLGLLYIEYCHEKNEEQCKITLDQKSLITNLANQISLALANFRLRDSLRTRAIRDPLTGLYNRGYLSETLFREIQRAARQKVLIAIVMLDIDHFKRFNDEHGHQAGDYVLQEVSKLLQKNIRSSDIACRYGGEEFLLMLYNMSEEEAESRVEKIRFEMSEMEIFFYNSSLGSITVSFGISFFPKDGKRAEELIEKADKALYLSKKTGRNKISLYHDDINSSENTSK